MAATGLKKWTPMTRSRRPVAWAMRVIGSEDVFEAKTVRSGQRSSSSENTMRFMSRASGTASMTKSTLAASRRRSAMRRRWRAASAAAVVSLPRSIARLRDASIPRRHSLRGGVGVKDQVL